MIIILKNIDILNLKKICHAIKWMKKKLSFIWIFTKSSEKTTLLILHSNLNCYGRVKRTRELNSQNHYLCFTIHHRTNDLLLRNDRVTKKQIITHQLISYLHYEKKWSYRKITKKFNDEWKIKTHTGKEWGKTGNSVYSVLKRFREREERLKLQNKKYDTEIKDFRISSL